MTGRRGALCSCKEFLVSAQPKEGLKIWPPPPRAPWHQRPGQVSRCRMAVEGGGRGVGKQLQINYIGKLIQPSTNYSREVLWPGSAVLPSESFTNAIQKRILSV